MSKFIQMLVDFVNKETDEQSKQIRSMWSQSVEARVAEGEAIAGLRVSSVTPNRLTLVFEQNMSKFRVGDQLRLNAGDPFKSPCMPCNMEEEATNSVTLSPGYQQTFFGLETNRAWVLDREVVDTRTLLIGALRQLEQNPEQLQRYTHHLNGQISPEIDSQEYAWAKQHAATLGMNASQAEGFANAFATRNYYLIQGPPGTGKTWVLAHLAVALAKRGERVLVTAFTHRAINNALRKIADATHFERVFKIGQQIHAEELGSVRNCERFDSTGLGDDETGFIVGGTCFATRTKRLSGRQFDAVVFDEASQVTLPVAFAGMLAGKKHVFIGDHQQMPPVVVAEHDVEWITKSIFELMHSKTPGTMLDITYRMNQEINAFPSRVFYGSRLKTNEENRGQRLKLPRQPTGWLGQLLDPAIPAVFASIPHTGCGMRSKGEAVVVAGLIYAAVNSGIDASEIAVVTPYRAQARLIRDYVRRMYPGNDLNNQVVVDTVERIQGQEREIILISLATSDPGHAQKRAAFYFMPNRLNVAITRARCKRIIVGSPFVLQASPEDLRHRNWVKLFEEFLQSSPVVSVSQEMVAELTDRPFEGIVDTRGNSCPSHPKTSFWSRFFKS